MRSYKLHLKTIVLLLAGTLFLPVFSQEYKHGMVVSAHPEASKVGVEVLKQGGNAIDAAVAVQFALAVVYPNAGNIGGGGFLVYRSSAGGLATLDYRETAPARASRDMFLDENKQPSADLSINGALAAGTPGTVAGMAEAHRKYGKLSWKKLLQPAIDLALNGFCITERQAAELNRNQKDFIKYNSTGIAFVKAAAWKVGDLLKQPELANTLALIRDKGRAGFYEGQTARLLVAEMKRGNGIISASDLKNYRAIWREPLTAAYKNYRIIAMPPPSSGGVALINLLKAIEPYPVSRWGFQQDSTVQLQVEAERRVYADRATHLGDPDYYRVLLKQLLDNNYIKERMRSVRFDKATPSSEVKAGNVSGKESEQTTHFSIVDKDGNAVSVTTTLNGSYGCKVVVAKAGFLLNDEMDDFSIKPGSPNQYGLVGGSANAIEPGKRMLSSMTPTILEKDGKLFLVVGSPGGSTIITSVFQTILNVIEFGMNIQQAVAAPRFHHQWLPDEVDVEAEAIAPAVRERLAGKGYHIDPRDKIGRVDAVLVSSVGLLQGGADPRGDDAAVGY